MPTCNPSHWLKRFWHSCPRWMNARNKNNPSMHHPWRWNVTASMVGLKKSHIRKNLTQNGEPQRFSWGRRRRRICGPPVLPYRTCLGFALASRAVVLCVAGIFLGQLHSTLIWIVLVSCIWHNTLLLRIELCLFHASDIMHCYWGLNCACCFIHLMSWLLLRIELCVSYIWCHALLLRIQLCFLCYATDIIHCFWGLNCACFMHLMSYTASEDWTELVSCIWHHALLLRIELCLFMHLMSYTASEDWTVLVSCILCHTLLLRIELCFLSPASVVSHFFWGLTSFFMICEDG